MLGTHGAMSSYGSGTLRECDVTATSEMAATLLAGCARLLSRTSIAHDDAMKATQRDENAIVAYRSEIAERVLGRLAAMGESIRNRRVLDLGCANGCQSVHYLEAGAASVIGVDIDAGAIAAAVAQYDDPRMSFHVSEIRRLPIDDASVDVILSCDVFEHVADVPGLLAECRRVLAPGGVLLIGTWGWGHPFAPHLWATMPVPWAHVLVSERTLLRACRRVYQASWYQPTRHDFDERGERLDKYRETALDRGYLNQYRVRDFERAFAASGLEPRVELLPFGSAPWTAPLLRVPVVREYLHGYLWALLRRSR